MSGFLDPARDWANDRGPFETQAETRMKKLACLLLLLLLAGCIPIGLKSSSLPFQSLVAPIA